MHFCLVKPNRNRNTNITYTIHLLTVRFLVQYGVDEWDGEVKPWLKALRVKLRNDTAFAIWFLEFSPCNDTVVRSSTNTGETNDKTRNDQESPTSSCQFHREGRRAKCVFINTIREKVEEPRSTLCLIVRVLIVGSTSRTGSTYLKTKTKKECLMYMNTHQNVTAEPVSAAVTSWKISLNIYTWENYKLMSNRTLPLSKYWIYNIKQSDESSTFPLSVSSIS